MTAILHESAPVRFWDHDLGPDQVRLFHVGPDRLLEAERLPKLAGTEDPGQFSGMRDLTPEPGRALDEETFELTPDGASVLTGWWQWDPAGQSHAELVAIDVASGKRQVLLSAPEYNFESPRVSPDGRLVVCLRETQSTAELPPDVTLVAARGQRRGRGRRAGRDLLPGLDRWPAEATWSRDSAAVYFAADDAGRRPVFRVDVATGEVRQVTGDDGVYTDLNPSPDGRYLYALRSAVDSPPTPVRLELDAAPGRGRAGPAGGAGRAADPARPGGGGRRRPPTTASRSGPGWCCPPARRPPARRRCCCGCTAAR